MKKTAIFLLAIVMVCSLFSCAGTGSNSSGNSTAPAASSGTPSPSASAPVSPSATVAASPSASTQVSTAPTGTKITADYIGLTDDGVNASSRKTYNLVYEYPTPLAIQDNINKALEQYSKKLNYSLKPQCANIDLDKFIQDLQVAIDAGTDGFLICADPTISIRINEVLTEAEKPYVALLNTMRDDKGTVIAPCATMDGIAAGAAEAQWLYDNYKKYWNDIDTKDLGLISFTLSVAPDLDARSKGSIDLYKALFPDNNNVFIADTIVASNFMDPQAAYDLASQIITAHTEIKYWFVTSPMDQYAQGAARAVESLGLSKNVLVTSVGSDILSSEWDNGYSGCFVSCLGVTNHQYSAAGICGLINLLDGKATADTLWPDKKTDGDKFATYYISTQMITKDTYKQYFADISEAVDSWINS